MYNCSAYQAKDLTSIKMYQSHKSIDQ